MNGRLFIRPTLRMATMINTLLAPGPLKKSVGHIGPCRPPEGKLILAIPAFRDRILPTVFCALGILGNALIALRLGLGGCHIYFLFANFVRILLLPALGLCQLKLRRSKTPFLTIADAQILLLRLMLPFAVLGQRPHGQHDMSVRIMTIGIMDAHVGAHSIRHKVGLDKISQQGNPLVSAQFNR